MRSINYRGKTTGILFIFLTLCFFSLMVSAQSPRRTPKPLATPPTRVLTGAEIISQSGDEEREQLVEPTITPAPVETPAAPVRRKAQHKPTYDEKQKRMVLNLDILTRAEQRSDGLRKQLFEMIEKENTIQARIDQIDADVRPEVIERSVQMAGSLHPEVIRDSRKKSLESERRNIELLLVEVQNRRANLSDNLLKSDTMVEKLRSKLEKDIDDSFLNDEIEPE
ncbi:MAG: hypothetical protein ABIV21_07210 [Pyrinomonadaceae bacterium]